jgi:MFS family permease
MKLATRHKIPRDIWALGFVSMLMDISSESIHGLLPIYLVSVLGASLTAVGLLEGVGESAVLLVKVFSGPFSDWLGNRKSLAVLGYSMAAISKPLFAIANSVPIVFSARIFDRIGKGIRGAPRDALIADLAPEGARGQAFGLRQSLDTVGAVLGPVIAIVLMSFSGNSYRTVFWFAAIPAFVSVIVLLVGVRPDKATGLSGRHKRLHLSDLKTFRNSFYWVAIAGALFQLARFSEAFLILRAKDSGLKFGLAPAVLIVMNIVYALSSYPLGRLSDRVPRARLLIAGLLVLCLSDLALAFGNNLFTIFLGVALWGLHMGLSQGTLAAMVADTCPPDRRGTAYGIFNLFSAIALLLASVIAGALWDNFGAQATFLAGAGFSALSLLAFLFINRPIALPP